VGTGPIGASPSARDRAVFHFLTEPSERRSYVNTLKKSLLPGGHVIIASFAIGGPQRCSGLPIVQYDSKKILQELGSEFELKDVRTEVHITPTQQRQAFAYFLFMRSAEEEAK
jgi:hypothetical protein